MNSIKNNELEIFLSTDPAGSNSLKKLLENIEKINDSNLFVKKEYESITTKSNSEILIALTIIIQMTESINILLPQVTNFLSMWNQRPGNKNVVIKKKNNDGQTEEITISGTNISRSEFIAVINDFAPNEEKEN